MASIVDTTQGNPGTFSPVTQVTKWVGGPGTGKTYTLLKFIEYERDQHGTDLKDIRFMSYSRSQMLDVRNRIKEIYPDSNEKDRERHVKTIHGTALYSLIRSKNIVMSQELGDGKDTVIQEGSQTWAFIDFCKLYGLQYNPKLGKITEDEDDVLIRGNLPNGNAFFSVNNYLAANMWPFTSWPYAVHEMGIKIDKRTIDTALFHKWEEYKTSRKLWEHEDYCKLALEAHPHLPGTVLIIDEFQDVSPSHNALYEMWRDQGTFNQIYLAGDDNQSIYGFRGANPEYIQNTPANLSGAWGGSVPVSHRCPSQVVQLADQVLRGRSNMVPREDGGTVEWVRKQSTPAVLDHILDLHQRYGKVMVLSRFRSHVQKWHELLDSNGIPHLSRSGKFFTWDKVIPERDGQTQNKRDMGDILGFLYAVDRYQTQGGPWTVPKKYALGLSAVLSVPEMNRKRTDSYLNHLKPGLPVSIPDLLTDKMGLPEDLTPYDLITHMQFKGRYDPQIKKRLNTAVSNGRYIMPGSIEVDTIHSVKGLESPAVVIDCSFLEDRVKDAKANPEEERRVGYVAVTRSSNHVSLIEPIHGPWNPVIEPVRGLWK